jgi:hypothetical protein
MEMTKLEHNCKSKSVIIDGEIHNSFKIFCKGKSLKIGGVIEDLILLYLTNPKIVQKMIDEKKDEKLVFEQLK